MQPITFSPLEAVLLGMLISVLTGVLIRWLTVRSFVSCEDCEQKHKIIEAGLQTMRDERKEDLKTQKQTMNIIFRMLRGLIIFSDIPQEKKEEILNDRESGK